MARSTKSYAQDNGDVLVDVDRVSKKFCRDLKKSLWYGIKDIAAEINPWQRPSTDQGNLRAQEFWALDEVSFQLRRGECLGLIGRNGAGKTTLLKMLNGLIKPDKGRITIRGRVGALIALGAGFNPILTGRENIYVNGSVLGLCKKEIDAKIDEIIDFSELSDFIDAPVQSYSSGMAVRLGFSVASVMDPDILLLDEVLAVGDMKFHAKCWNKLGSLREQGVSFILVSHQMLNIERLCTTASYLENGRMRVSDDKYGAMQAYQLDYQNAMKDTGSPSSKQCAGSGRVTISGVRFKDINGQDCVTIESGQPISVCVDYIRHCEGLNNPTLEISIRDSGGMLYQMSNRGNSVPLGRLSGEGTIKAAFSSLPSNNETLSLSVSLWNEDMSELLDWRRGLFLEVLGYSYSTGRVHLATTWTTD